MLPQASGQDFDCSGTPIASSC